MINPLNSREWTRCPRSIASLIRLEQFPVISSLFILAQKWKPSSCCMHCFHMLREISLRLVDQFSNLVYFFETRVDPFTRFIYLSNEREKAWNVFLFNLLLFVRMKALLHPQYLSSWKARLLGNLLLIFLSLFDLLLSFSYLLFLLLNRLMIYDRLCQKGLPLV